MSYDGARQRAIDVILGGDQKGMAGSRVAECVVRVVRSKAPRLRVGQDAVWLPRLKWLSWPLYERGIRARYALDKMDR